MSAVDFGSYKRIVQRFFDPEPRNDGVLGSEIWCLGTAYRSGPPLPNGHGSQEPESGKHNETFADSFESVPRSVPKATMNGVSAPKDDAQRDDGEADNGWPKDFLDDCEARPWFTYRSNFSPIKKSSDASMTLSVRLRSLTDQQGFTSDTGWGCMIRSGQCLLANSLITIRLGRGTAPDISLISVC